MAITCWAPNCNHNNIRETCKFFRFSIDQKQFARWKKLLRRDAVPGPGARICSCHFRDREKSNGPELFTHNIGKAFKQHYLSPEKRKRRTTHTVTSHQDEASTSTSAVRNVFIQEPDVEDVVLEEPAPALSTSATSEPSTSKTIKSSATVMEAEIYVLKLELERKDEIINTLQLHFTYNNICGREELVLLYTGLPTANIFESLCHLLEDIEVHYYSKWNVQKLSKVDQLLLTLMKLRQNFLHLDLAQRFQVSQATVSNIVITYIHLLKRTLCDQLMKTIPTRQKNKSCLPSCCSTFTNCRIIIDCTEIFAAIPRKSMRKQRLTYSSYKHRNTWKGLVGCAPNGVITFVSGLYAGSSSDKAIVKACGLLQHLQPGDLILADKGFLIRDLLPEGVSLNIPPFLETPQFLPEQIRRTQCIARARIHVERAIRRMKCYKILSFIPEKLFAYSSSIFKTVAALTNLQYPLIKEVQQFYDNKSEM